MFWKPGSREAASASRTGSREGIGALQPSIVELVRAGRTMDAIKLLRGMRKMSLPEAKRRVDGIKRKLKA